MCEGKPTLYEGQRPAMGILSAGTGKLVRVDEGKYRRFSEENPLEPVQ